MDHTLKVCTRCKEAKPATAEVFVTHHGELRNTCRACQNAGKRARRAREGDKVRAVDAALRERNREHNREVRRRRYHADPSGQRERSLRYQERHPERVRAQWKRLRVVHHDKHQLAVRAWILRNREHLRERQRKHRAQNPDAYRAKWAKRRAALRGASGAFTANDVRRQYDLQRGLCWWCGKPVGEKFHADHLIPIARGGSNEPSNIVIACPWCNVSKGAKMPHEFAGRLF